MTSRHWNNIAIEVAVFLLHQDYGEQYLAQIIRFYKENPLLLFCKIFVWLFLILWHSINVGPTTTADRKSIYEGELVQNESRKGQVKTFMTMSEFQRNPAGW